jgi:hypothetical protein
MLDEIEKLSPAEDTRTLSRDLSFVIEELNSKGSFQVTRHYHLGKIRGNDVLRYLKSELKRQGIKTEIRRRSLIRAD